VFVLFNAACYRVLWNIQFIHITTALLKLPGSYVKDVRISQTQRCNPSAAMLQSMLISQSSRVEHCSCTSPCRSQGWLRVLDQLYNMSDWSITGLSRLISYIIRMAWDNDQPYVRDHHRVSGAFLYTRDDADCRQIAGTICTQYPISTRVSLLCVVFGSW